MKSIFLRIIEVLFAVLLLFGILCIIVSLSEPELGMTGVVVFSIWSILSLIVFLKVRKKRKGLKTNKIESKDDDGIVRGYTPSKPNVAVENKAKVEVEVRTNNPVRQETVPVNPIQSRSNEAVKAEKIKVKPEELSFGDVIQRYLTTDHSKVPSIYDYYGYFRAEFNCILNNIPRYRFDLSSEKVLRNKEILTPYEKSAIITTKTTKNEVANFVVVDTETTGLRPGGNDIIEVTAIKFENFVPVSAFTTLLKPRNSIPEDATRINGITDEMVQSAPTFAQIKRALEEFIGNYPIVAHNAEFDVKFLHVSGFNFSENQVFFDTLELSRQHIRDCMDGTKLENYKLATVCEECSIYFDGAHRSMADALATGLLFIEIIKTVFDNEDIFAIKFSEKPLTSLEELDDWEYYQTQKPVKTFTVTSREEFDDVSSYSVGDEVDQGYDVDKGKETLEINYGEVCYIPKSVQDFFEENYGDYRMFVLDAYEADNGKVKIKIGIYNAK